jgi:hypothetical protein
MLWGVVLWFLSQAIVTPMMGGGFFSADMGGMMAVVASLMGHVVYGVLLGAIAGAADESPPAARAYAAPAGGSRV